MLAKIAMLGLWVALVDVWLARHFGAGLTGDKILMLAGVPLAGVIVSSVADYLLEEGETKRAKTAARTWIRNRLSYSMLAFLYISLAGAGCFYTSVKIQVPEGEPEQRRLVLTAKGGVVPTADMMVASGKQTTIGFFVNPLAIDFQLELSGYQDRSTPVFPFVGASVGPSDFKPLPTLLFRPRQLDFQFLAGGGTTQFYVRQDDGSFHQFARVTGNQAWTLGPRRSQPARLFSDWRLDLTADGFSAKDAASQIRKWRTAKPVRLPGAPELTTDTVVCAVIANVDGNQFSGGAVRQIGTGEYTDVPLLEVSTFIGSADHESMVDGSAVCRLLDTDHGNP